MRRGSGGRLWWKQCGSASLLAGMAAVLGGAVFAVGLNIPLDSIEVLRLEDSKVGYILFYPTDWQVKGKVIATEFANGTQCQSVEVVDAAPPPEAGPAAFMLHSFVQVCSKLLTDSSTLNDFMRQTYGDAFTAQFQTTEVGGLRAYQTTTKDFDTIIFLQTNNYRIQIVTSVKAPSEKQSKRISQVQEILDSFSLEKTSSSYNQL